MRNWEQLASAFVAIEQWCDGHQMLALGGGCGRWVWAAGVGDGCGAKMRAIWGHLFEPSPGSTSTVSPISRTSCPMRLTSLAWVAVRCCVTANTLRIEGRERRVSVCTVSAPVLVRVRCSSASGSCGGTHSIQTKISEFVLHAKRSRSWLFTSSVSRSTWRSQQSHEWLTNTFGLPR